MNSIRNKDIKNQEKRKYLEEHLKSSDFFNTTVYPQAILNIQEIKTLPSGKTEFKSRLTIMDVTHSVIHYGKLTYRDGLVSGKTTLSFNRLKYGIHIDLSNSFQSSRSNIKNNIMIDAVIGL